MNMNAAAQSATNRVAHTRSTMHGLTRVQGKGRNRVYVTTQRIDNVRVMTGTATRKGWGYSGPITPYRRGGAIHL
jgi:hypothetical protein